MQGQDELTRGEKIREAIILLIIVGGLAFFLLREVLP